MKKRLLSSLAAIVLVLTGLTVFGQDVHFSQFYASPLTLNPAMTGFFNGDCRVAVNYRNQWSSLLGSEAFVTTSASYDMAFLQGDITGDDFIGGGIMILNDKSGFVGLTNNKIMLSGSYHKNLGDHNLALGVQFGIHQKSLNFNNLTYPQDYNPGTGEFETGFGVPEQFNNTSVTYPDLQVGLLYYASLNPTLDVYAGAAYFHILQPVESFLNEKNRLPSRIVAHGGIRYELTSEMDLVPNTIFMTQNGAQEFNIGSVLEYSVSMGALGQSGISFGPYYRFSLAPNEVGKSGLSSQDLIVMTGVEYKTFKFGFSYDFNVNSLSPVSKNRGGFELSLLYICNLGSTSSRVILPCPRF